MLGLCVWGSFAPEGWSAAPTQAGVLAGSRPGCWPFPCGSCQPGCTPAHVSSAQSRAPAGSSCARPHCLSSRACLPSLSATRQARPSRGARGNASPFRRPSSILPCGWSGTSFIRPFTGRGTRGLFPPSAVVTAAAVQICSRPCAHRRSVRAMGRFRVYCFEGPATCLPQQLPRFPFPPATPESRSRSASRPARTPSVPGLAIPAGTEETPVAVVSCVLSVAKDVEHLSVCSSPTILIYLFIYSDVYIFKWKMSTSV